MGQEGRKQQDGVGQAGHHEAGWRGEDSNHTVTTRTSDPASHALAHTEKAG